jgi:hypothetical protein
MLMYRQVHGMSHPINEYDLKTQKLQKYLNKKTNAYLPSNLSYHTNIMLSYRVVYISVHLLM